MASHWLARLAVKGEEYIQFTQIGSCKEDLSLLFKTNYLIYMEDQIKLAYVFKTFI